MPELIHGTIYVKIFEASGLVDEDRLTGVAPLFIRTMVETFEDATGLGRGKSRLYATVELDNYRVGRTRTIMDGPSRVVWNEEFRIYAAHRASHLIFNIKNFTSYGGTLIGMAKIPISVVTSEEVIDNWFPLVNDNGNPLKGGKAKVRVKMQFLDAINAPHWNHGLASPDYDGVPYTYFPQRKGCEVTLYQDAHMSNNFLPPIRLAGGMEKEPTRCWEDIYNGIKEAQHLIYITGWSVYTEVKLIRDKERMIEGAEGVTLGELLKRKADEGVTVNILLWDDWTSQPILKDLYAGRMATHDEDTREYFQGTNVNCMLCTRTPDESMTYIQGVESGVFTHHQKAVILDAPGRSGQRRIVTFIGGIDLCDGRYDTQDHPLFESLSTVHHDDFHQPNFYRSAIEKGGPRGPWHDIHSKLEGLVAWDVLFNFEARWRKQFSDKVDLLVPITDLPDVTEPEPVTDEDNDQAWNVQIFRSIDDTSVTFPEVPEAAAKLGLVSGRDNTIDRSIQDAYIHAIRRAKDFIYIENQYFFGSCFAWDDKTDVLATHVIPAELALKIVFKIQVGEPFAVYIITPMWPEGAPDDGAAQAILDWQNRTMSMMYKQIATALRSHGSHKSPKDYLNFYCLGNREAFHKGEFTPTSQPDYRSNYLLAQKNRRFMIYVHSKMMIVDDEYIIVGSANINERSLNGGRDSEIAMGAWQPKHICGKNGPARSQIHGFRMSLWYEHLGRLDESFFKPSSTQSVKMWNTIAKDMWVLYTQEKPVDMPAHILPFPVAVSDDGEVTSLPDQPNFPDSQAKVVGAFQSPIRWPPLVTT